jgi:hypothetical protein
MTLVAHPEAPIQVASLEHCGNELASVRKIQWVLELTDFYPTASCEERYHRPRRRN